MITENMRISIVVGFPTIIWLFGRKIRINDNKQQKRRVIVCLN